MITSLSECRTSAHETERISRLFDLIPAKGAKALDIGARDGHLSRLLAQRFAEVVALDLETPQIDHPNIRCLKGDATELEFANGEFDVVICAEVLEHIPSPLLAKVGLEISRVTRGAAIIGVPYKQDLRMACTTCQSCGEVNPPWGHVSSFDEGRLRSLFPALQVAQTDYVGSAEPTTNALSAALMTFAGNPYGTYIQDEPCVHCGQALGQPRSRRTLQRLATRSAYSLNKLQQYFASPRPNWIHMRLEPIPVQSR